MNLPEFTKKLVETKLADYCERKIPEHVRDKVRLIYKIIGNKVTLLETRPFYCDPLTWTQTPIAQFRFDPATQQWALYFMDRNARWRLHERVEPNAVFENILEEIDRDSIGRFWG
jgi:hypothetical protein